MAIEIPPGGTCWDATPAQKREAALEAELATIDTAMGWEPFVKEPGWRATRLRELRVQDAEKMRTAYNEAVLASGRANEACHQAASLVLDTLGHIEDQAAFKRAVKAIRILLDLPK